MMKPCTKERTRELEKCTVPISNKCNSLPDGETRDVLFSSLCQLTSWYYYQGFDANEIQKIQNAKIAELLEFKPQYHVCTGSDNYRNAVWGFEYKDKGCVLYHSKKGLALQVEKSMNSDTVVALVDLMCKKLCSKS